MFFEQNPILDALCTIGVFVAAWCLATLVMAFLGYCIHNGLWWTEPRLLDLNGNGGRRRRTAPTTAMPLAPELEVDGDGKAPAMPLAPGLEVDGDGKAPAMPLAPGLEVDGDGKAPAMPLAPGLEVDGDGKAPAMPLAPELEVDGDGKAPAMPLAPELEVDGDGKVLASSASSSVPSLSSDRKPNPPEPVGQSG